MTLDGISVGVGLGTAAKFDRDFFFGTGGEGGYKRVILNVIEGILCETHRLLHPFRGRHDSLTMSWRASSWPRGSRALGITLALRVFLETLALRGPLETLALRGFLETLALRVIKSLALLGSKSSRVRKECVERILILIRPQ
jgi:hypothetical protein